MPTIKIDKNRCKGCVLCVEACPRELIRQEKTINDQGYQYVALEDAAGQCTGCKVCAVVCPDICIEVYK